VPENRVDDDGPGVADLGPLARAAEAMEKAFGADSPEARAVQRKLAQARRERDGAKPLRTQILAAERKIGRKRRATDAAEQHHKDLEAAVAAAKRKAEEARLAHEALRGELRAMEDELRDLQLRVVSGDACQMPPPGAADDVASAGLQWPVLPQAVRDLPGVQAVLVEAAGAIRRIVATAEFEASGRDEWADADDYEEEMECDGAGQPAADTVYVEMRTPTAQAPLGVATPVASQEPPVGGTATPTGGVAPCTPQAHVQGHRGGLPEVAPLPGGVGGRHGASPFASWRRGRNAVSRSRSPERQQQQQQQQPQQRDPRQRTMDEFLAQSARRG
jgi:hypothetical protein